MDFHQAGTVDFQKARFTAEFRSQESGVRIEEDTLRRGYPMSKARGFQQGMSFLFSTT
ncbi:hypothetical protein [Trichormus sp. NMC-1]|uniref:hypothetical protein n=1 Tax=Trichormus sp. NMC-1 TaxID=1853259 RepID=UPI000B0748B1|nr:hypothetical protein [Trichormus sp. NMC-1]